MKLKGYVNTLPDSKGNLMITSGVMQIKAKLSDVRRAEEEVENPLKKSTKHGSNYSGTFSKAKTILKDNQSNAHCFQACKTA